VIFCILKLSTVAVLIAEERVVVIPAYCGSNLPAIFSSSVVTVPPCDPNALI